MNTILSRGVTVLTAVILTCATPALAASGSASGGSGGGGGNSGCTRIQSMTTVFGWRDGEYAPSVQTAYSVKPCDKKETVAMRYTLTDDATGAVMVALNMPELIGGVIVPSTAYIVGNSYTVKLDVVSLKNGSTLETRSQSVVANF